MTKDKTVTMPRELAESLDCGRNLKVAIDALPELRALLAASVVERQEPVAYVLAKQTVIEVPGHERKELGYTLFDGIGVFHSREEVHAAIAELGLPIGWVSMTVDQLLLGYMMPEDTSPPAPVAVVLPEDVTCVFDDQNTKQKRKGLDPLTQAQKLLIGIGFNACLDKVKELNQ